MDATGCESDIIASRTGKVESLRRKGFPSAPVRQVTGGVTQATLQKDSLPQ